MNFAPLQLSSRSFHVFNSLLFALLRCCWHHNPPTTACKLLGTPRSGKHRKKWQIPNDVTRNNYHHIGRWTFWLRAACTLWRGTVDRLFQAPYSSILIILGASWGQPLSNSSLHILPLFQMDLIWCSHDLWCIHNPDTAWCLSILGPRSSIISGADRATSNLPHTMSHQAVSFAYRQLPWISPANLLGVVSKTSNRFKSFNFKSRFCCSSPCPPTLRILGAHYLAMLKKNRTASYQYWSSFHLLIGCPFPRGICRVALLSCGARPLPYLKGGEGNLSPHWVSETKWPQLNLQDQQV